LTILYKTQLSSDAGLPTFWWDASRADADNTLQTYSRNMFTASKFSPYIYTLEQWCVEIPQRTRHLRILQITEVLNGVYVNRLLLRIQVHRSEVIHYERCKKPAHAKTDIIPITPPNYPTNEYAEYYKMLLDNPALYELCARCNTLRTWYEIAGRAQVKANRAILRWLYRLVHSGGDNATG